MKEETRGGFYGGNFAVLIDYVFQTISEDERRDYEKRFFKELGHFDNGSWELKNMDCIDPLVPEDLAKLVKEGFHLMYQKNTSRNALDGFLKNI